MARQESCGPSGHGLGFSRYVDPRWRPAHSAETRVERSRRATTLGQHSPTPAPPANRGEGPPRPPRSQATTDPPRARAAEACARFPRATRRGAACRGRRARRARGSRRWGRRKESEGERAKARPPAGDLLGEKEKQRVETARPIKFVFLLSFLLFANIYIYIYIYDLLFVVFVCLLRTSIPHVASGLPAPPTRHHQQATRVMIRHPGVIVVTEPPSAPLSLRPVLLSHGGRCGDATPNLPAGSEIKRGIGGEGFFCCFPTAAAAFHPHVFARAGVRPSPGPGPGGAGVSPGSG
jgi:hypothetical protein